MKTGTEGVRLIPGGTTLTRTFTIGNPLAVSQATGTPTPNPRQHGKVKPKGKSKPTPKVKKTK